MCLLEGIPSVYKQLIGQSQDSNFLSVPVIDTYITDIMLECKKESVSDKHCNIST